MARATTLEARLTEWGHEYGGSKYDDTGWHGISPLASLIKYHGRPPQGLNPGRIETNGPADEVERSVRALEKQDQGFVSASVLRCEYFVFDTREVKLRKLSRVGARMDTSRYSHHLRIAKVHVAAWLRLPFDEPANPEDAIALLELMTGT
jgi:hypothetical protein